MTATMRLLQVEWRRSVALWFFPLMALAGCWYALNRMRPIQVVVWLHSSAQIGETLIVLAPLMGGVAAWAAGRDHRHGIGDLLATTPRPHSRRLLAGWGGALLWGIAAYLIVGAFVVAMTLRDDAWGTPSVTPVIIGLLTIVTGSAFGYLAGTLFPSRLVPPLVPISIFILVGMLNAGGTLDSPASNLSPWTVSDRLLFENANNVFYEVPSMHLLPMTLWLLGLTGLALAGTVLARDRRVAPVVSLACSAIIAVIGAGMLLVAFDEPEHLQPPWETRQLAPYTPTCVERSIPVCVHPAFESHLIDYAERVDLLIEPLEGLPGAPTRAEQLPYASGMYPDGTLTLDLVSPRMEMEALALVQEPVEPGPGWKMDHDVGPEQAVIARWLARRVDPAAFDQWWDRLEWHEDGTVTRQPIQDAIDAAVERFTALDAAEQRRWLEANYVDLRAGRLSLADLP